MARIGATEPPVAGERTVTTNAGTKRRWSRGRRTDEGHAEVRIAEEQRHRIAMDLHDGPAQELAYLVTVARELQHERPDRRVGHIIEAAERAMDELRFVIEVGVDPGGTRLDVLLPDIAERITERSGVRLLVTGHHDVTVTNAVADALGRIVREAVNNAVAHGRARTISLDICSSPDLVVTVADDGSGFDTTAGGRPGGYGLTSMAERAARIGARCVVESAPGRGTTVDVVLPPDEIVVRP